MMHEPDRDVSALADLKKQHRIFSHGLTRMVAKKDAGML